MDQPDPVKLVPQAIQQSYKNTTNSNASNILRYKMLIAIILVFNFSILLHNSKTHLPNKMFLEKDPPIFFCNFRKHQRFIKKHHPASVWPVRVISSTDPVPAD